MNYISFPNLGIFDLEIEKVAFEVFGHEIVWYGIIITCAIACAALYSFFRLRQHGIVTDHFLDLAIATVIFGVIGTRLFYVLTNLESFDSFWEIFAIWNGGLAIYGGIIGGATALIVSAVIKKMNVFKVLDSVGPGVMLGQIIGRWGNFFNAEAYGSIDLFEFFGNKYDISLFSQENPLLMTINDGVSTILCQPTFLYESLWNLFGFIVINIFFKKKRYDGEVALWYIGWYGLGRTFIEGLRTDSLYIGNIKVSQLIGLVCFLTCLLVLIVLRVRKYNTQKTLYCCDEEDDIQSCEENV